MTLVSSIIFRAYRRHNLVAKTATLTTEETDEALDALNGLIPSLLGNEAGSELSDLDIGGGNDMSSYVSSGAPDDCRLVLNLSAAEAIDLDPLPYEGQRIAIVDAGESLATYNLTLSGNGRRIEEGSSVVLSTSGLSRQWLYRADTANWHRISDLTTSDQMPFPQEFDELFIVRLAIILAPQHSASLSPEAASDLERAETKLRARYRKRRPLQDSGALGLMGQSYGGSGGELSQFRRG